MKDILKEVFSKIEVTNTLKSVTDKGVEKLAASAAGHSRLCLGNTTATGTAGNKTGSDWMEKDADKHARNIVKGKGGVHATTEKRSQRAVAGH